MSPWRTDGLSCFYLGLISGILVQQGLITLVDWF